MLPTPQQKLIETTAYKWLGFVNSDSILKTQQISGKDLHSIKESKAPVCL